MHCFMGIGTYIEVNERLANFQKYTNIMLYRLEPHSPQGTIFSFRLRVMSSSITRLLSADNL